MSAILGIPLLAAALLAFPFGPLFPWSPWKPGYRHLTGSRADVFCPSRTRLPAAYTRLDDIVAEAEQFHGLRALGRITVVLCAGWGDCVRFMPMLRNHAIGAITLPTGTVVYVTPRLDEMRFDHGEFLRHEISHAVLHQNQSWYAAWRISKLQWFTEGMAVSFGRQKSFITRNEFLQHARKDNFAAWIDPEMRGPSLDMRVAYVVWRHFVEYVMAAGGAPRFRQYTYACLQHPHGWRAQFAEIFGRDFRSAIAAFQADVTSGRWQPAP